MSKERETSNSDFEDIIRIAKEVIIRDGNHQPMLLIKNTKRWIGGQFDRLPPTADARQALVYSVGYHHGLSGKMGGLTDIYLISEGWLSHAENELSPAIPPSENPNRVEILFVTHLRAVDELIKGAVFEVIRDEDNNVIRLEDMVLESTQDRVLTKYLLGFRNGQQKRIGGNGRC